MEPETNSQNHENIPRGCLKFNNKIYPVFEGLNTVGRNLEAVINIKNLNISSQHAIITVIDENGHYVSDLKSSNGTIVDNKKLKPLKLYKLNNGASIKFGDVFCTYKKLDHNELVLDTFEESQNFTESFYSVNTQTVHLQGSDEPVFNEMLTQVVEPREVSFNEMPTQVVPYNANINEMPTQVIDFNNPDNVDDIQHDTSSSDSLDFITMQKATQSQSFALNGHSSSDTEEPDKLKSGTNKLNSDSDDVYSTPEIHPVKLNPSRNIPSSDSEPTTSAPEVKNTPSDLEQEEPLSQICPVKKSSKTTIQSDSESDTEEYNIQDVSSARRKSRYIISDDDETDIEDEGKGETTLNESDIIPNTQKGESSKNLELEQSSMMSLRLELSDRIDENLEEMKESNVNTEKKVLSIAQENIYCQDTSKLNNSHNLGTSVVDGDHIYCRSIIEDNQNESVSEDKPNEQASNLQSTERNVEQGEDLNIQKTPVEEAAINEPKTDPGQPREQQNLVDDETQSITGDVEDNQEDIEKLLSDTEQKVENEIGDISDQSAQQVADTQSVIEHKDQNSECTEELVESSDQKFEEKQQEDDKQSEPTMEETNPVLHNKGQNSTCIEELMESSDPKFVERRKDNEKKTEATVDTDQEDTQSVLGDENQNSECTEENRMCYSDQKFQEKLPEDEKKSDSNQSTEEILAADYQTNEDIFAQPTQQMEFNFIEDKNKCNADDDIYLQSTQQVSKPEDTQNKYKTDDDDDIYIQATQKINDDFEQTSKSDEPRKSDDFYLLPTQELIENKLENKQSKVNEPSVTKEHEFTRPFEVVTTEKKSKVFEDEDETFLLPPTQALEFLHKEDEASTSNKPDNHTDENSNSKEVEDQLEQLFYSQSDHMFVATQQLVDVLEEKNDEDIIDDSIVEENNFSNDKFSFKSRDSKDPKFDSVDSIRMLLDDDLTKTSASTSATTKKEEVEVKESKEETVKKPVRTYGKSKAKGKVGESSEETTSEKNHEREGEAGKDGNNVEGVIETFLGTRSKQKREEVKENKVEFTEDKTEEKDSKSARNRRRGRSEETTSEKDNERECEGGKEGNSREEVTKTFTHNRSKRNIKEKKEEVKENDVEFIEEKIEEKESKNSRNRTRGKKDHDEDSVTSEDKYSDKTDEADINVVQETSKRTRGKKKNVETNDDVKKPSTRQKKKEDSSESDKNSETSEDKYSDTTDNSDINVVQGSSKTTRGKRKNVETNDDVKKPSTRQKQKEDSPENDKNSETSEDKYSDKNDNLDINVVQENNKRTRGKKKNVDTNDDAKKPSSRQKQKENFSETDSDTYQEKDDRKTNIENDVGKKPSIIRKQKEDSSKKESGTIQEKEDAKTSKNLMKQGSTTSMTTRKRILQSNTSANDQSSEDQEVKAKTRRKNSVTKDTNDNLSDSINDKVSTSNKQSEKKKPEAIKEHDSSGDKEEPSTSTRTMTRKRNLKVTDVDSGDEFEGKVENVDSPKKAKMMKPPETPTTRKSTRTRKLKMVEDEVISVPSSSSTVPSEVISISSTASDESMKKSRRLSANSRAQLREDGKNKEKDTTVRGKNAESKTPEEDKTKQKETRVRGRKASVQEPPTPATPERNKRQLKPKVVFTMMDNPELESLIRQLGGSVVDTVDACTVLVTESVKRSHKLLCAVGQAKPICSPQWLLACKKSYSFLDPWDYILVDKEGETKWQFSLRESLNRSGRTKLLENYTFQLIVNQAADVLKGAIEACGGKYVTRNLVKADTDNKVIVSTAENKKKWSNIVKQNPEIKVVEPEAIFDGTLRQEFRFNQYLLT